MRIQAIPLLVVFCFASGVVVGTRAASNSVDAILQADRDFDRVTSEKGIDGWVSYFAADGKMFRGDATIVSGHAGIRELMAPLFAKPGNSLRWKPVGGEIAASGDLGFTHGESEFRGAGPDGKRTARSGRYVTIWKKQSSGAWKVIVDIGTSGPVRPVE